MSNHLAGSKSPYLLQHAENPVDWYPWSDEAFERALAEDKPVLVSIGYSACHWCHVMAHESFENAATAQLMNSQFICVKVDREERPDVDAVYMDAVQMMTGQGGWPLNVFVTPDRRPFFGGTYWPPAPRPGLGSWPQVLQSVSLAWRNERSRLETSASSVMEHIDRSTDVTQSQDQSPSESTLSEALEVARSYFDSHHGGFGGAPKFPQPANLEFLLRMHARTGSPEALEMVRLTLDHMAAGGINDQLGGGFHRYSVDATWTVPHFEKMLYDNAQLARLYVEAWQVTGSDTYRVTAERTLDYVLRDLLAPNGGFYSSEDADSEGQEGVFYVWDPAEVEAILGPRQSEIVSRHFGIRASGNFEGKTVLTIAEPIDDLAASFGMSRAEVSLEMDTARGKLLDARGDRTRPGRDVKILTDWNALMVRSLALAGRAFDRPDYVNAASRCATFLLGSLRQDGRLIHVYNDGLGDPIGFLDDYAFLIEALAALFEATGDMAWLETAQDLSKTMLDQFADPAGGFFVTAGNSIHQLPVRPKSLTDSVVPSGNSSAAMGLLRLEHLTDVANLAKAALATMRLVAPVLGQHALSFGYMLSALDYYLAVRSEVVVVGPSDEDATAALAGEAYRCFLPNTLRVITQPESISGSDMALLAGRDLVDGHAAAYVCQNYVCALPVTDPQSLTTLLNQQPSS